MHCMSLPCIFGSSQAIFSRLCHGKAGRTSAAIRPPGETRENPRTCPPTRHVYEQTRAISRKKWPRTQAGSLAPSRTAQRRQHNPKSDALTSTKLAIAHQARFRPPSRPERTFRPPSQVKHAFRPMAQKTPPRLYGMTAIPSQAGIEAGFSVRSN